jgi:hypothetical protein
MRRFLTLASCVALCLPGPVVADPGKPPLPPTAALPAHAQQTPAQAAAQDMMVIYEGLCLDRFPNPETFGQALAANHAIPLDAAATKAALLGHPGTAWTVAGSLGLYVVALASPPARNCVVTGEGADDEGVRAVFRMVVTSFAKDHEFGTLQNPPVAEGNVGGAPAILQQIAALPEGLPRQAFVNMGVKQANGATRLRLTREMAPH